MLGGGQRECTDLDLVWKEGENWAANSLSPRRSSELQARPRFASQPCSSRPSPPDHTALVLCDPGAYPSSGSQAGGLELGDPSQRCEH